MASRPGIIGTTLIFLGGEQLCRRRDCPKTRDGPNCSYLPGWEQLCRGCDCPKTRDGPDCSVLLDGEQMRRRCMELNYHVPNGALGCSDMSPFSRFNASLCLNNCNGRGKCEGGFCHCLP
eukprot:536681-Pelagomonas_calceolata.AAC.1